MYIYGNIAPNSSLNEKGSSKTFRENQSLHTLYVQYFLFSNACEIMWENIVMAARLQTTVWRMRIACWIPKAANKVAEYVIFIAFPLQQWLHDRTSVLRYTYIAYLVRF